MSPEPQDRRGHSSTAVWQVVALTVSASGRLFGAAVVTQVAASVGAPALAAIAGRLVDRVVAGAPAAPLIIALVSVFIAQRLAGLATSSLVTLTQQHAAAEAAARLVEKAATIDVGHQHDPGFHDRLRHAEEAAASRFGSVVMRLVALTGAAAGTVGLAGVLSTISPVSALLFLGALAPWVVFEQRGFAEVKRRRDELVAARRRQSYYRTLVTQDDAALELLASAAGTAIAERHRQLAEDVLARELPAHRRQFLLIATGTALGGALLVGGFLHAVAAVVSSRSVGDVATLVAGLTAFLQTSSNLANSTSGLLADLPYLKDYFAVLDTARLLVVRPNTAPVASAPALLCDQVTFAYPASAEPVLRDITLQVDSGEILALVGENGAGKSTLVKLLLRFYDADSGRILVGGNDLRSLRPEEVRARVGVLFQDFARYQLSLREAVTLGSPPSEVDDERVTDVLERAGLGDLLARLDSRLDTQLGRLFPGGIELSGGQWQRLALARLLYRDTPIVVLDEPTSGLDPKAEEAVFETLRAAMGSKAAVVISHRFSTVRAADRIAVISGGSIAETGTHEELCSIGGVYAGLFEIQAARYR